MTTKKILITGLRADIDEVGVRALLERFGPVTRVDIIRDGNADEPVALAEMSIGDGPAAYLTFRLTNYWHDGKVINARLMHH